MNATAIAPRTAQEDLTEFRMPVPKVGQPVLWYKSGLLSDRGGEIRYVERVNAKSVNISGGYHNCLHVSDPRLMLNQHQRENGAWTFTDQDTALEERFAAMEARIADLEARLPVKKAKKDEGDA